MASSSPDVLVVHDYLNQRGGAERCVLEMARLWPGATVLTSLYRPKSTFPGFEDIDVRTSFLNRLPVDRGFRNLFPLYPAAFYSLGRLDARLVLSSSSGWAHSVRTTPASFHAVYCYTPARWLYGREYLRAGARERLLSPVQGALRRWDARAARRPDLYIAISKLTRDRIRDTYGRTAPVVYPPVDVDRFTPKPRGDRLLVVSRLMPYKRVDLVVRAATLAGIGLDIVGQGPDLQRLRATAGPTVAFHGALGDHAVRELFEGCRAFVLPGTEDFGITPIEANAAGKPVVAYAAGGALETVRDGVTGVLFRGQQPDDLINAIRLSDSLTTTPEALASHAQQFSPSVFRSRLVAALRATTAPVPGESSG